MDMEQKTAHLANRKKSKTIIISVLISVAFIIVLLIGASIGIDMYKDKLASQTTAIDFDFYPVDYDEDIYEDYEYVEKITGQFIQFYDPTGNMGTVGIDRETAKQWGGEELEFIVEMLYDAIEGDYESYNDRFSANYYKTNQPKEKFTKQKIYDVMITYEPAESSTDGNYTKSVYSVEYRILKNNGTFRNDIGDGSRKQYITVIKENGEYRIDSLVTVKLVFAD